MSVNRQIEVYANGKVLHYDCQHIQDAYGGLADQPLGSDDFAAFEITPAEFEQVWESQRPLNKQT